jgi:hypothetical protein
MSWKDIIKEKTKAQRDSEDASDALAQDAFDKMIREMLDHETQSNHPSLEFGTKEKVLALAKKESFKVPGRNEYTFTPIKSDENSAEFKILYKTSGRYVMWVKFEFVEETVIEGDITNSVKYRIHDKLNEYSELNQTKEERWKHFSRKR